MKNIRFFIINVAGLGLVIAVFLFIWSWVKFEESYDRNFKYSDRLYRISFEYTDGEVPRDYARVNFEKWIANFNGFFSEVESVVRISPSVARLSPAASLNVRCEETDLKAKQGFETDSTFFRAFNIQLTAGNKNHILTEPHSVILSETFARKCYPGTSAIGKPFYVCRNDTVRYAYTVTGIMSDFSPNRHMHPDYLASFHNPEEFNSPFYVYFLLKENASVQSLENSLTAFKQKFLTAEQTKSIIFHLIPVKDIHLHSDKMLEIEPNGNAVMILTLKIISLLLLLIALINSVNLQLAAFQSRKKYILVNSVLGSRKKSIAVLLSLEGVVTSLGALVLGVFLFYLLSGKLANWLQIKIPFDNLNDFLVIAIFFVILGVISGLYPFLRLIKIKGVDSPGKKSFKFIDSKKETNVRTALVLAQFTAAIVLIILTLGISRQLDFSMKNRIGKSQGNILTISNLPPNIVNNYSTFRQELLKRSGISDVTYHMYQPGGEPLGCSTFTFNNQSPDGKKIFMFPVSHNFNNFYGIKLLAGEDFTEMKPGEKSVKYMINETALHFMGYTNPKDVIGKQFKYDYFGTDWLDNGYISGVVEDTYISSFEIKEKPLAMYYMNGFLLSISVKYRKDQIETALRSLKEVWDRMAPEKPLEFKHINQTYEELYADYIKQKKLLGFLLCIVMFITCLGLFALSSYIITNRTKEVGIHKVNGAHISEVVTMLNKDFITWVFIAFLIACPIAWYAMHKWLENFAYKTDLSWWIFAAAGGIAVIIALITVSWQSWRAATRNPVESLRYE